MLLKFNTESEYMDFIDKIRANTSVMPSIFSNYKAGFYSKISNLIFLLMYASSSSWSSVPSPSHLKFYGINIKTKEKRYLFGFISIELWISILLLLAFLIEFFQQNMVVCCVYIVIISLIAYWTRNDRAEIKKFLYKYM